MAWLEDGIVSCPPMTFTEANARAAPLLDHLQQWVPECFPSHPANEPDRSAAEHVKLRSLPLLGTVVTCSGTVCWLLNLWFAFLGFKEKH